MELILQKIEQGDPYQELVKLLEHRAGEGKITVGGVAGSQVPLLVAGIVRKIGRPAVLISRDRGMAERWREDLNLLMAGGDVVSFSGDGTQDIPALRALAAGALVTLVTDPGALLVQLPPPQNVASRAISLAAGSTLSLASLREELERLGFLCKEFVESSGDYAVRGGIVDVFPFVGENPVRVEFFGESVESLREFDSLSQRSIRQLSSAVIVPNLLSAPEAAEPVTRESGLLDYFLPGTLVFLDEPDLVRAGFEEASRRQEPPPQSFAEVEALLELFPRVLLRSATSGPSDVGFGSFPQPSFNSSIRTLRQSLSDYQRRGFHLVLSCDGAAEVARLKDLLLSIDSPGGGEEEIDAPPVLDLAGIEFHHHSLHEGFLCPPAGLVYFTEHQIFNRVKRQGRKRAARFKGISERDLQQLQRGDFVVHADFGIGRFAGLNRLRVGMSEQEVVKVLYAEKDTLYVNLNYINRLQKYSSQEGHVPKLSRLGSPDWERLKSRTKNRVKDIARDLIRLYAARKHKSGHAFSPDTPWQKELEASFQYEDTFDQAKATLEVKQDMEVPVPMDRLICGDVGFGKTEVAVRAAFKAVMDSKQVAVLVPTTILALQHFNTFVDRTSRYGVQVRVISRFKPKQEQQRILAELAAGSADIVIGTHRLLSKDVRFKDLGLLIIDEEHRFGVTAKEKLRQFRAEVDTLSLTATPIPRTLHFSLMGARDLSIIATAPRNRLPIITEITQWNDDLIREAVVKELQRGGQAYFVHDRIQKIEEITERLRGLLPGIRIAVAHGQMHAHELEEVMLNFLERRVDILVSTKIIESGLDIPNVNTIIINRADRFGMAELYQLRGRVGRSNAQAYAHLLAPPFSVLPAVTLRRLQALQEFNELGSGFNLAMRDLEIRGAGNLLGSEQSGFIESMGFETYTRVLEEAVQELKQEEFVGLFPAETQVLHRAEGTVVEPEFDALIPESYISSDVERLTIYRRLYSLTSGSQLSEVAAEVRDRFGKFPPEVENLFGIVRLRLHAALAGFRKVNISEHRMEIEFPPESESHFYEGEKFQRLMSTISGLKDRGLTLKQSASSLRLHVDFRSAAQREPPLEAGLGVLQLLASS